MSAFASALRRARKLERLARARTWALYPEVTVGARVQVGRGCRLIVDGASHVTLADGCELDDGTTLAAYDAQIVVGPGSFIGHHCTIAARETVRLGPRVFLAELVSVRDHDHDPALPPADGAVVTAPVTIGADAWLGCKVTVLRGTTIGNRAVIGANAVVRGDIPAGATAVGIPARVVKQGPTT